MAVIIDLVSIEANIHFIMSQTSQVILRIICFHLWLVLTGKKIMKTALSTIDISAFWQ